MVNFLNKPRSVVAYLAVFCAVSSNQNDDVLVNGFVPIQQHAGRNLVGFPSVGKIANDKGSGSGILQEIGRCNARNERHKLSAVPPSVWWILGHATLPFSGVPFVVNGTREGGWYRKIDLPPWTPPDSLFGPVWTFLYTCMGLAVSRISRLSTTSPMKNPLVLLWMGHFVLNMSWAPIFFGLQRFRMGLAISCVLIGSLAAIIPLFYAVDPTAAFLLVPYALWLAFATFGLNLSICRRNPTRNGYNEAMFQAQLIKLQEDAATLVGLH
mmetsp:Transcript_26843/g.63071  ORF Transcript_26843/g.63071 Transcript_26843/m.63071 type:complete len:268 (+) Transcript_26843:68-871(+)